LRNSKWKKQLRHRLKRCLIEPSPTPQERMCAMCGSLLHEDTPEEIVFMRKEYEQNFGCKMPDPKSTVGVCEICDKCYQTINHNQKQLEETEPDKYTELMVQCYAECKSMEPKEGSHISPNQ